MQAKRAYSRGVGTKRPRGHAAADLRQPPRNDRGILKAQDAPPDNSTLMQQAETRTEQANLRTDQANTRTDQANARTVQADRRTAEANTRTEQADLRTVNAETLSDAVRASELSYRRLFESARDGILILDSDTGRITDVNPFLVELLGFSHGDMVGKSVGELSPFKDAVANLAMLDRLQKDGYVRYEGLPLETRDGRRIEVEFVSNVYLADGHKVIQCNIRDITERIRTEEALDKFFDQPMSLNLIARLDGVIHRVSTGLGDLLGYGRAHLVGVNFLDLVHPDDRAATLAEMGRLAQGIRTFHFENRYRHKNGEFRHLAWSASVSHADHTLFAVAIDITELKRAEQGIRRLNRTYALLSDINKLIVREKEAAPLLAAACRIVVDTGKFCMAWVGMLNAETQQLTLVASAGDIEDYTSQVNIDLRDWSHLNGPSIRCLHSGEHAICSDIEHDPDYVPWRDEALRRGYRASGGFPLKVDGKTIGVFNLYADAPDLFDPDELRLLDELAADISFALEVSQREAEGRRMEESHVRLTLAVEQAAETIVITDTDGTILYVNPAFENTTGYTRAEALGQNPRLIKSGKQDAAFYRQMWDVLRRGEVWRGHFINKRKDGALYEEEATISPVRDVTGKVVNYVAVKNDVTREVQLEAQFRQSQKLEGIGQLAGGVAHDFNNVLAVIMMQAELTGTIENLPEEVRESLAEIFAAAGRAASLTRQLLLFSRKEVMQPRPLDVSDVVTSLAKMLQRTIREDVGLELHLCSTPLMTYADAGMLDQVLMNLAVNARDAMPDGGTLVIETAERIISAEQAALNPDASPGRFVRLSVSDTGCGIPPEIQTRVFEPFFTTKEAGKGTGLGLATVFGIVKQHNGWLEVDSEVGKGTTFQVFLPASAVPAAAVLEGDKARRKPRGGSETILLAEDDAAVRKSTRMTLERNGYHVLEAADGVTAQQVWTEHQGRIALLLTDVIMPGGVDGWGLAALLQKQDPQLRVIVTSGYSADIAGRALELPAGQKFIQKPCPPEQLLEAVRDCLDDQKPRHRSPF